MHWTCCIGHVAGWGKLVFFDTEEHQLSSPGKVVSQIPKLEPQWKVIHDFKPTEYLHQSTSVVSLHLAQKTETGAAFVGIGFRFPLIGLGHGIFGGRFFWTDGKCSAP